MKALLFILILVPLLVIGCAQATQVSPEPPTAPNALPEEVAPEASPTVEIARTLVVEPVGEGSYAVGSRGSRQSEGNAYQLRRILALHPFLACMFHDAGSQR